MDRELLRALLERQDGVVCRQQVLECGGADHDIRRMLRRRELAVVHEGVYVDHTGPLTWRATLQKDDDLDRDLDLTVEQRIGLRLGWGQVFRRTCVTAWRVARILQLRGWTGQVVPCGPDCGLRDRPAA